MKVIAFCEAYSAGGNPRYALDCLEALPKVYSEIVLKTNNPSFFQKSTNEVPKRTKVIQIPFLSYNRITEFTNKSRLQNIILAKMLFKICLLFEPLFLFVNSLIFLNIVYKKRPDIIFGFNGGYPASLATLAFSFAGNFLKVPVILSIVSLPQKRKNMFSSFLDKMVWGCCKHILVNCKAIKEALIIDRKAPRKKIKVIYNTLKEQENSMVMPNKKNKINIGFFSRIEREKGIFILYESFKKIEKKFSNVRLVFIGEGSSLEELKEKVKKDRFSKKVDIRGYHYGTSFSALKDFDIFVLPSFVEGLPYALLEAMRCGKAIIATRVGGIPEIITSEKEGLLISSNSVEECKSALEMLLSSRIKRNLMAKNASDAYHNFYSLVHFESKIAEILGT